MAHIGLVDESFPDVVCEICGEIFEKPKVLPGCSHAFCDNCIKQLPVSKQDNTEYAKIYAWCPNRGLCLQNHESGDERGLCSLCKKRHIDFSIFPRCSHCDNTSEQLPTSKQSQVKAEYDKIYAKCPTNGTIYAQNLGEKGGNCYYCEKRHIIVSSTLSISKVECPTCGILSDVPNKLDDIPVCTALSNLADRFRALKDVVTKANSCSHVILESFFGAAISKMKCDHCDEEFCQNCCLNHIEKLRDEAIELHNTFKNRISQLTATVVPSKAALEKAVVEDLEQVKTDSAKHLNQIYTVLQTEREKVVKRAEKAASDIQFGINAAFLSALAHIDNSIEIDEQVKRVKAISPKNLQLSDVVGVRCAVRKRDRMLVFLETMEQTARKKMRFAPKDVSTDIGSLLIEGTKGAVLDDSETVETVSVYMDEDGSPIF